MIPDMLAIAQQACAQVLSPLSPEWWLLVKLDETEVMVVFPT
jgi:hypothetical protein